MCWFPSWWAFWKPTQPCPDSVSPLQAPSVMAFPATTPTAMMPYAMVGQQNAASAHTHTREQRAKTGHGRVTAVGWFCPLVHADACLPSAPPDGLRGDDAAGPALLSAWDQTSQPVWGQSRGPGEPAVETLHIHTPSPSARRTKC